MKKVLDLKIISKQYKQYTIPYTFLSTHHYKAKKRLKLVRKLIHNPEVTGSNRPRYKNKP
jgi:hypothetical protein